MSEEYSFPEYGEELQKIIDMFGSTKLETYKEKDITPTVGPKRRATAVEL